VGVSYLGAMREVETRGGVRKKTGTKGKDKLYLLDADSEPRGRIESEQKRRGRASGEGKEVTNGHMTSSRVTAQKGRN